MGYRLGVDLGTTYTAAAVNTGDRPVMIGLGNRELQVPSVLCFPAEGGLLVGEAAERRGAVEPGRLAREFKRRMGDSVPILVGGTPYSAEALTARLLRWVVDAVTERQGGPPDRVTVTHPANWGPYKADLLGQATRLAELDAVDTITEPEAAAVMYAARTPLSEDESIAIYDLGGGTFDAAVLRRTADGFAIVGSPEGIEHLGGADFDEAVFQHVLTSLGTGVTAPDAEDPGVTMALARLRRDCVVAKEALSADTETVIPVVLPGLSSTVRLTREELEAMLRPTVRDTVASMHRALRSARVQPEELSAIVLVGGSSRIPLVSQLLIAEFGRPIALDTHPKHDIALGAALLYAGPPAPPRPAAGEPVPFAGATVRRSEPVEWPADGLDAPVVPPPLGLTPFVIDEVRAGRLDAERSRRRSLRLLGVVVGAVVVAAASAFAVPSAVPESRPAASGIFVNNHDLGDEAAIRVDVDEPLIVQVPAPPPGAAAELTVQLGGVDIARSKRVRITGAAPAELSLRTARLLVAGPVRGRLTVTARGAPDRTVPLLLTPIDRPWFATIPGAGLVGLGLFVLAYTEALLRPVYRRARARLADLVGMTLIGGAAGVALVALAWIVADRLPGVPQTALTVAATAVAGLAATLLVAERPS